MGFITYSDDEKKIVESGVAAIGDVLEGNDVNAKERLLLCLDYYLDPYYKNTLPYGKEITGLLEHVIISNNPLSLKEDALNLLTSYGYPPFPILEQNLSCIEDQLMPDVMYALNMGRSDGLLYACWISAAASSGNLQDMPGARTLRTTGKCPNRPSSNIVKTRPPKSQAT